mgnify:CR=1 FL=1
MSVTTKLNVVRSLVDISVKVCCSNQTSLGLLPVSVISSSCSSLSLNDDDLQFGETNPALRIEALLLVVAMPDVLVCAEPL